MVEPGEGFRGEGGKGGFNGGEGHHDGLKVGVLVLVVGVRGRERGPYLFGWVLADLAEGFQSEGNRFQGSFLGYGK